MDKAYDHKKIEEKIYSEWEKNDYFSPIARFGKHEEDTYSIVLPPPNVTGTLHIGHALMLVIEDILIRYNRMKGFNTLWLPGTDHAAIATQSKVESILYKEEEKTRHDLGREEFLQRVEEFAKTSHDTIVNQIKKMGASVDWKREAYTLDEERNLAVRVAFKKMYDLGLIYRGETIVNWDPKLQTTVSDDEIEWKDESAQFYYLKYGPFTIGTARPETKFGDKYVVMHPADSRYEKYKDGEKIEVEWINGKITATIIKDEAIDMEFGTGVMTITPWHDKTDYEIAKRHKLDTEQVVDFKGKLLPVAGDLAGLHIKKARPLIVEKLKQKGLIEKIDENYQHRIATNYRGGGIIEPQILAQWMVAVNKEFVLAHSEIEGIESGSKVTLKELMKHVVEKNLIKINPDRFVKTYYHWIDNLRDWCISRQLWYGHRIPAWFCEKCSNVIVEDEAVPEKCSKCNSKDVRQDPDTLDTWFSSGLWTFSTLGWPKETEDLKIFHPTSVLETGYDIIFFWVARMILMTTSLLGQVPFRQVLLHGLVRDAEKQKMSKSKGNVIDPLDLSEKYGTDALRMALVFSTAAGSDIPMSEDKVRGMKYFTNKLWNIARFIVDFKPEDSAQEISSNIADQEIIKKLKDISGKVSSAIDQFRLHDGAQELYQFIWHEFADKYVESVKERRAEAQPTLEYVFKTSLALLHPFMPFITEELYQKFESDKHLIVEKWPFVASAPQGKPIND